MKRAAPTGGASRGTKKARAVSDDEDAAGDDDGEWLRAAGVPLLQYVLEVAVDACVCVRVWPFLSALQVTMAAITVRVVGGSSRRSMGSIFSPTHSLCFTGYLPPPPSPPPPAA